MEWDEVRIATMMAHDDTGDLTQEEDSNMQELTDKQRAKRTSAPAPHMSPMQTHFGRQSLPTIVCDSSIHADSLEGLERLRGAGDRRSPKSE